MNFRKASRLLIPLIVFILSFAAAVNVSAASDDLIASSGVKLSLELKDHDPEYVSVTLSESGRLKISGMIASDYIDVIVYDNASRQMKPKSGVYTKEDGYVSYGFKYDLDKGTYRIKLMNSSRNYKKGKFKAEITAVFPEEKKETEDNISVILEKGDTLRLSVVSDGSKMTGITWSSSDKSVVSVDKNGKIKALKKGNAVITAKYKSKTMKFYVVVE